MQLSPYISVIATTQARHPERLERFIHAWVEQAKRYSLDSELVVAVREPLSSPPPRLIDTEPCELRFLDLSGYAASVIAAKNAAIRRARGMFLLSTSHDARFSEQLVEFLASRPLESGRLYRLDGDFILMAREHWIDLRGYAELDRAPRHLDTLLCCAASQSGVREEIIGVRHPEHTPEPESGKPIPDEEVEWLVSQMRTLQTPLIFNTGDWGLAGFTLPEVAQPADACGAEMVR